MLVAASDTQCHHFVALGRRRSQRQPATPQTKAHWFAAEMNRAQTSLWPIWTTQVLSSSVHPRPVHFTDCGRPSSRAVWKTTAMCRLNAKAGVL